MKDMNLSPMLNAYPDSMGGRLSDIAAFLHRGEVRGAFGSFYILPSVFNSDLDRGFSIIDYGLNAELASPDDIDSLREAGVDLLADLVLNHISVQSPQFRDLLEKGEKSEYRDFFIDWNAFWAGHGTMGPDGVVVPDPELIRDMFFRKPGLPVLMVRFPDGHEVPYWNTFYQEVRRSVPDPSELAAALGIPPDTANELALSVAEALSAGKAPREAELGELEEYREAAAEYVESRRTYLGQMDVNVRSPLAMRYYADTLQTLADYGVSIVRLDAFAYASKLVGRRNFLNEPETWELLEKLDGIASPLGLELLPEIHESYAEGTYLKLARRGYMVYDFFLPGLIIDAFERRSGEYIAKWGRETLSEGIRTVNMLGCHDGIPLLDLKGLIPEEDIQRLIDTVVARGGIVKDLHGAKNVYYQVNATYFSALGADERRLPLARAVQLFMPGKPQIWYLDLFAGENDIDAVRRAGAGGHKEINRTDLTAAQVSAGLDRPVVRAQLDLLRFRNSFPAFSPDAEVTFRTDGTKLAVTWRGNGARAELIADFADSSFSVTGKNGDETIKIEQ